MATKTLKVLIIYFAASHPEVAGDGSKIIHQTRQTAFDATPK